MKKMIFTLVALLTMSVSVNAMSYEQARNEALFLTDKMAYELNLTDAQYEAAYEINLDYLMGVTSQYDVFGPYWERRNLDLSYILYSWQWEAFRAATYFYRPLYWNAGYWHFGIYARYPHRDYFYFGRPHFFATYRGGHSWHMNGGRSFYEGRRNHFRPEVHGREHFGMRNGWDRGDYRGRGNSSTRVTGDRRMRGERMGNGRMDSRRMDNGRMDSRSRDEGIRGNGSVNRGYSDNGTRGYSERGGNGLRSYGGSSSMGNRSVESNNLNASPRSVGNGSRSIGSGNMGSSNSSRSANGIRSIGSPDGGSSRSRSTGILGNGTSRSVGSGSMGSSSSSSRSFGSSTRSSGSPSFGSSTRSSGSSFGSSPRSSGSSFSRPSSGSSHSSGSSSRGGLRSGGRR
jgi:hypothetical protein